MKKVLLLLLTAFIVLTSYAQQNANPSDQEKLLLDAHQSKSAEKLLTFFKNWQRETPTITAQELKLMNDTIKEAYKVFTAFYHIKQLKALGGFKGNKENFYDDAIFLLIQNELDLHVTDKVYWTEAEADSIAVATIKSSNLTDHYKRGELARPYGKLRRSTIYDWGPTSEHNKLHLVNDKALDIVNNFRPTIDEGDKGPLYLSDDRKKILNSFLGTSSHLITGRDSATLNYINDLPLRRKFIDPYIKIFHWSQDLNSGPYVSKITLDRNLKYARVDYRLWAERGEAFLKNDHGKWVLLMATRLWIE